MRDLSVGMQQRVEILKALYRGARLLILDEPTSVLTPPEAERLFEVVEGLVDGDGHVFGLSQADQRAVARGDGDFGFMAMLFDGEDDLGFESVAQDLAEFGEAGFNFFADGGSYFVVPAGVFHVH